MCALRVERFAGPMAVGQTATAGSDRAGPSRAARRPNALARLAAGFRRRLARHRWLTWVALAAAIAVTVAAVNSVTRRAEAAQLAWGTPVTAWVSIGDVAAGEPIAATRVEFPSLLVPATAVTTDPSGRVALHPLADGAIVVDGAVVGNGLTPPDAWVVAIADPLLGAPLIGTDVAVLAEGVVLTAEGLVVGIDDAADGFGAVALVAVPATDAATVAAAARLDIASLAIRP